jgi:hypothetical protein
LPLVEPFLHTVNRTRQQPFFALHRGDLIVAAATRIAGSAGFGA